MQLRKKIRYILIPVIALVFTMSTAVYYNVYKDQIIANKLLSLDDRLQNLKLMSQYHLAYTKSFIRQKIDSKEAFLIFDVIKQGKEMAAPYITQLLKRFVDKQNDSNNTTNIVNDFTIFGFDKEVLFYVNTRDPFAQAELKKQTEKIIDKAAVTEPDSDKLFQYYYFIETDSEQKFSSMNIIEIFSPFYLTSKPTYNKNDELYLIQSEINVDFVKEEIQRIISEHKDYMSFTFTDKNSVTNNISVSGTPLINNNNGLYESTFETELFEVKFILDERYFDDILWSIILKLSVLNIMLIVTCSFILLMMIDKQIILPITNLAKSIKQVELSDDIKLKPLSTKDEVADLNESYISFINKINNLASNDALTGLSNRGSFNKKLLLIDNRTTAQKHYLALFFIDLDNFKHVNDTFGHETGDQLLIAFSQRLKKTLRSQDKFITADTINSIARLGGDEFVILIDGLPTLEVIENIAKRICALFNNGFVIDNNVYDVHASIGIAYSNDNSDSGETLLNQADSAMYMAKRDGKNTYKVFSPEIEAEIDHEKKIEKEITNALAKNELFFVFMPAYSAANLKLQGYELLLRCPALSKENIGPDIFIPIAEKTDLIIKIDMWVAENALARLAEMVLTNDFCGFISVNISSRSLKNNRLYKHLQMLINKHKINPKQLELEITETCLMPDDKKAVASLTQLKSLGVKVTLDDFGTGYTSFSQLNNYPLDTLKIDRSFIKNLNKTPAGKKPTLDIIFELAKVYQLEVIVEGIETQDEFKHVRNLGCDIVQGFYFTQPLTWQSVIENKYQLEQG
ncbi:putative bifunctional diguanylate cyclase/phosphodiesterase [Psychromonas aquimarina]|uniref:putative bifunctional diguanylate cyclase/phosphodiesterase n=1 Tax=Psychromonas aquimarina TaxID=444919 RepID=UPI00041EC487|nr:EAL domain-containing protein [Psychromonas aquimarina]